MAEFNRSYKDLFINKNDYLDVLSKEDLFSKIENNSNNDDWARVVVDAINTQGNNIVQALKRSRIDKSISNCRTICCT